MRVMPIDNQPTPRNEKVLSESRLVDEPCANWRKPTDSAPPGPLRLAGPTSLDPTAFTAR